MKRHVQYLIEINQEETERNTADEDLNTVIRNSQQNVECQLKIYIASVTKININFNSINIAGILILISGKSDSNDFDFCSYSLVTVQD